MDIKKQRVVAMIAEQGRYMYCDGVVFKLKSTGWKPLSPNNHPTGYRQISVYNGKRGKNGLQARVYVHQFVYILHHGVYGSGYVIDHIDRNRGNNKIENLRAVTNGVNRANSAKPSKYTNTGIDPIGYYEIKRIRRLMNDGLSQSAIARVLGLKRLAVRYIIKRIESGAKLMFEHPRHS
jgi:hypothetical protein